MDDAEVDVYSWDRRVCRGEPTEEQVKALVKLREFGLRTYQKGMWREVRGYMAGKYGTMEHSSLTSTVRSRTREEWQEAHMVWRLTNASGWLVRAWKDKERVREGKTTRQAEVLGQEIEAMREIMWRTAENDWFEYAAPLDSTKNAFVGGVGAAVARSASSR